MLCQPIKLSCGYLGLSTFPSINDRFRNASQRRNVDTGLPICFTPRPQLRTDDLFRGHAIPWSAVFELDDVAHFCLLF